MMSRLKVEMSNTKYYSFRPGEVWPDNHGVHINAHGGGVIFHNGFYYWFGEHKIEGEAGNAAHVGVHVYSAGGLYNWKDEGIALAVSDDPGSPAALLPVVEMGGGGAQSPRAVSIAPRVPPERGRVAGKCSR